MTLGQQHSKGELGGVGFSIDDLIDGTKDALAGIVEPFRVHDMRPVPIEPCAVTGAGHCKPRPEQEKVQR